MSWGTALTLIICKVCSISTYASWMRDDTSLRQMTRFKNELCDISVIVPVRSRRVLADDTNKPLAGQPVWYEHIITWLAA